jgi:hypothetical protein
MTTAPTTEAKQVLAEQMFRVNYQHLIDKHPELSTNLTALLKAAEMMQDNYTTLADELEAIKNRDTTRLVGQVIERVVYNSEKKNYEQF